MMSTNEATETLLENLVKQGKDNQTQDSAPLNLEVVRCSLAGTV